MHKSRKLIAILATLALLATLLVPMVGPASAASTYSMNYVQKINAGYSGQVGTLVVTMDPASASTSAGKFVVLSLPSSPSGYVLFPGYLQTSVSGSGTVTINNTSLDFSLPITLISGQLVVTLNGSNFTGWGGYTVEATVTGTVNGASIESTSKYLGTVNVSGTIKNTSGAIQATFSGTVDLASATATTLTLTPAAGVTLPTGAGVTATVTTNSPAAAALPSITGTNYFDTANGATFKLERISATEVKLTVVAVGSSANIKTNEDSRIQIPLVIEVPTGVSGDITLTASAPSTSTFSSGSVVIARVGVGKVTLAAESVPSISSSGGPIGVIDLKEDVKGALLNSGGTEALKLRLPPGFKWRTPGSSNIATMWGDASLAGNISFTTDNDRRDLLIWNSVPSASGTFLKLSLAIDVDESVAKAGEVKVTVSGATTADPSELIVANYGEYGVTVKAYSTTDIIAGKVAQDIGKLEIDEAIPGSLISGRTITLTLPENVRWSQAPNIDTELSQNYGSLSISSNLVGSDGRMLKITFNNSTQGQAEPAKLVLKNMQVTPAADFSGDLNIEVGGSQGVTGTVVLAKVNAPVAATASSTPQVIIGKPDQAVGDVTITENMADAIHGTVKGYTPENPGDKFVNSTTPGGQAKLVIEAPPGVTFSGTPKVEVIEGDLQIDAAAVSTDKTAALEGQIIIPVKSSSTKPSTIKVSGIKVTVDRTVPEGDLTFEVKGTAVNETITTVGSSGTTSEDLFQGHNTVAKAVVAQCVTPAPGEQKATVVFKVGDTKFTVNGAEQTMDVAPYVKNGRTFIPVRYSAQAVGVTPDNILYSGGKVTLIKGDKVVQFTIGSNVMLINGVAVTMDVKAEITNGRTMLPFRYVAQALGAQVNWDPTEQTVTMTL